MTPCKYGDPLCPCPDGDPCHYEGNNPMTTSQEWAERLSGYAPEEFMPRTPTPTLDKLHRAMVHKWANDPAPWSNATQAKLAAWRKWRRRWSGI